MPTRNLTFNDTPSSTINWLEENFENRNQIEAAVEHLKDVSEERGIYFWFMEQEAYESLSEFINVDALPGTYSRHMSGVQYDLVYIGTAGSRPNSSGWNKGNLRQRLKWHLFDNRGAKHVCNGTISTFRKTIAALLGNDLIENDVQVRLDRIFRDYFKIAFIEYQGDFYDVHPIINNDEAFLIDNLTPLFNIRSNKNARAPETMTNTIKKRRNIIELSTKLRLVNDEFDEDIYLSDDLTVEVRTTNECQLFEVNAHQLVDEVAEAFPNLLCGRCTIELFDSLNNNSVYPKEKGSSVRSIRAAGRTVSEYFKSPDTNFLEGNISKSVVVQQLMIEENINSIIVRVCPIYSAI